MNTFMRRRDVLKMLALAVVDPDVLVWTPGRRTVIDAPRYTWEQYQQWRQFERNKAGWRDFLSNLERNLSHPQFGHAELLDAAADMRRDVYERIQAGDRRARELGIV